MTTAQAYFHRNRGEWTWRTHFEVTSWRGLWRSSLPLDRKFSFSLFIASQYLFGDYTLWTKVNFVEGSHEVGHETRLAKFGITFMKSEKTFHLNPNGTDLELRGREYFWPRLSKAHPFPPLPGSVESSATRASYQMPLFGTVSDCKAVLEPNQGEVEIRTSWLKGTFTLTPSSMEILNSRFQEPASSEVTATLEE